MTHLHSGGTVGNMLVTSIARHADRPAISDGERCWTYREMGLLVGRFMTLLRSTGLKKGDALSILASNRADVWAAICAAMIMGLRYTPLHPLAAEDDHAWVIEDADIDVLIVEAAKFGARGNAIRQRVPTLRQMLAFGPLEGTRDLLAELDAAEPAPLIDEGDSDDIAFLAYTGGTTGKSKGVMLTHRSLIAMTLILHSDWDWPREIRFLAVTPISHAAGVMLFPMILRGGYARVMPGFDAEAFAACIAREKINATFLVPTLIYGLIDNADLRGRHDFSSLDMIVYGAAPISPDRLLEALRIFGRIFVQLYGQTEAPNCISTLRKADHDPARPEQLGSCGRPSPMIDVRLFDAGMREVGVGEPGEICVRGSLVMDGYWKRPDATAETLRGNWLHTGDVAVRDENGLLYIVDRTKDLIVTGGFNVYPREVEDALMSHSSVATVAVIGIPDDKWGEAIKAFVVLKPGVQASAKQLQAHVKDKRGALWSPKSIDFLAAIPLTGLGKTDRNALRAPYWKGRARSVA